jgi:hypothetical protein
VKQHEQQIVLLDRDPILLLALEIHDSNEKKRKHSRYMTTLILCHLRTLKDGVVPFCATPEVDYPILDEAEIWR